jgi:K+-transporting ATPase ATPase C chain
MKSNIFPSIRLTIICLVFFSGLYSLVVLVIAQFAPNSGKGEIMTYQGKKFYVNIAQDFSDDKYFSSRPSVVAYNAAGSAGSNQATSNPDHLASLKSRVDSFLVHNPGIDLKDIPSDLITASGSGLDPDISVDAATIQVKRIAKVRGIPEPEIETLVQQAIEKPFLGLFGPQKINVLKLNIALDNLSAHLSNSQ